MNSIVDINRTSKFSINEARKLLPIFYHITELSFQIVKDNSNKISAFADAGHPKVQELESEINKIIDSWQEKVIKLGGRPSGLWTVDFDNGEGYYCWKFPEVEINHWHGYQDGFSGRILIE